MHLNFRFRYPISEKNDANTNLAATQLKRNLNALTNLHTFSNADQKPCKDEFDVVSLISELQWIMLLSHFWAGGGGWMGSEQNKDACRDQMID